MGIASNGVNANHWFPDSLQRTAETVTHEIGHNQGLAHVYCPDDQVGAAGTDPSYPYQDGKIGNPGFGIRNYTLFRADLAVDYMSYCSPAWVSDWTWNKNWVTQQALTQQGFAGLPQVPTLRTAIYPDGSTTSWTTIAVPPADEGLTGNHRFEFERDGNIVEMPGVLERLSDDQTIWVSTPLPDPQVDAKAYTITRISDGVRSPVTLAQLLVR